MQVRNWSRVWVRALMVVALGVLPQVTATCADGTYVINLPNMWWGGGDCDDDDDDCDGGWGWFGYDPGYCYDCY